MSAQCQHCDTLNPPAAKFCCECGARLQKAAPEGETASAAPIAIPWLGKDGDLERRQLTIVFYDLVGLTEFASRLDPEDLRELIGGYHRCVGEILERHAGFVAQYLGDGVLAYFGYPKAGEDDAERAIRASLEISQAVQRLESPHGKLHTRAGIATGLTVISELTASGGQRERSAMGETPNMAARLQALAPPEGVVIAPLTRRLVGDQFEYRDIGSVTLKGFAQPVHVTQVLSERKTENRFLSLHATNATLVGRGGEFATVRRLWKSACGRVGNTALIVGEPGIGKSRLVAALEEELAAMPHQKLRFVCSPQYSGSTLRPVIHQLERLAGFEVSDWRSVCARSAGRARQRAVAQQSRRRGGGSGGRQTGGDGSALAASPPSSVAPLAPSSSAPPSSSLASLVTATTQRGYRTGPLYCGPVSI